MKPLAPKFSFTRRIDPGPAQRPTLRTSIVPPSRPELAPLAPTLPGFQAVQTADASPRSEPESAPRSDPTESANCYRMVDPEFVARRRCKAK